MDNIYYLFIIDKYLPNPTSNGSCAANIIESLANREIKSVVLSLYDEEDRIIKALKELIW